MTALVNSLKATLLSLFSMRKNLVVNGNIFVGRANIHMYGFPSIFSTNSIHRLKTLCKRTEMQSMLIIWL